MDPWAQERTQHKAAVNGDGHARGLPAVRQRPRSVGKPAPVVVMEWTFAENRTGLTLEFYVAKSMDEAVKLRERLMALRLPDGATERSVTLRERLPWPSGTELELRLEQQDIMARGILAGLAATQDDQGGSDGAEENSE